MNYDLKIIKKKYGEKMSKLCRELFPTLLEQEGLLSNLILNNFEASHELYNDILKNNKINQFKNYIYKLVGLEDNYKSELTKTPEELLSEAGYILYPECKCEKDIQKFKKYYNEKEVLCTFHGGRLLRCRVFFAVKKDVDKIKREDFKNPKREDLYGTSVISIQFTKDKSNTLSIKNRYNHTVNNPDNTYLNNLDNIIPGLTKSFEKYYGIVQKNINFDFELPNYVKADGKYYKYSYEINNIYYGTNNTIIDNYEVKKYPKEKYIILDYFILDLVNKKIKLYDKKILDSFSITIENIEKIEIINEDKNRIIKIINKNNEITEITINKENQIIKIKNDNLKKIKNYFLTLNNTLEELYLKNVRCVNSYFLYFNKSLKILDLPNVEKIKNCCLYKNEGIQKLHLENVKEIGDNFIFYNKTLKKLSMPKVEKIGNGFLYCNCLLDELDLSNVKEIGDCFMYNNKALTDLNLPKVERIKNLFLCENDILKKIYTPNLKHVGNYFLYESKNLAFKNYPVKMLKKRY